MRKFLYAVVLQVVSITCNCQTSPCIKHVKGVVLHQYEYTGHHFYCDRHPLLIKDNDTLTFIFDSSVNSDMIDSNKGYEKMLGKSDTYSYKYWKEYDERNPIHNLRFSKYDFLDRDNGSKVMSNSIYEKTNKSLYTAYQFEGQVIIYDSISYTPPSPTDVPSPSDCICYPKRSPIKKTAILKNTIKLKKLTSRQQRRLSLNKIAAKSIDILMCE